MNHTPGPWTASGRNVLAPYGDRHRLIAQTGQTYVYGDSVIGEADARLIAAAPDLLAALEELTGLEYLDYGRGSALVQARAAIAKAKGE